MSLPRPTGLKAPSKVGRPSIGSPKQSGIPGLNSGPPSRAQSALAKSARAAGLSSKQADVYAAGQIDLLKGPEPPAVIDTDDFKIGDRVWVSGTKPGVIAFIGEAQFAPGEWAGIVLDEPKGKNDGSVAGVRYFQCEALRGVFSRLSKLSKTEGVIPVKPPSTTSAGNGTSSPVPRSQTPRSSLLASKVRSTSNVSLSKESPQTSISNLRGGLAMSKSSLRLGDRVVVGGTKVGILKFLGVTDFAVGDWAGVELDGPMGKNDGAVAGKRYFDCRPMHGLFAPSHKVTRLSGQATPSPGSRLNTSLRSTRDRSGSQESISSIGSNTSSVSRSRMNTSRLGNRPGSLNLTANTTALQKALKEKEEHIEQLLRERDLERAEVARAAAQVDEAEGELASVRHDTERTTFEAEEQILQLKGMVTDLELEKKTIGVKLEEEKRKCEDLQFQIEEEVISKDDLEQSRTEDDVAKVRELERGQKREKDRAEVMEKELANFKEVCSQQQSKLKEGEDTQTTYLDQMEELTYKLNQAESKVHTYESSRLEEGAKMSQVGLDLAEQASHVGELEESNRAHKKAIKLLEDKLVAMGEELADASNKRQKMEATMSELSSKLRESESSHAKLTDEIRALKSKGSDLQHRLQTSQDKMEELTEDRKRLEEQVSDLMKNTGDNSNQLSSMSTQLAEKTRKLEDLQSDLSKCTLKISSLNENIQQQSVDGEKHVATILDKCKEDVRGVEQKLEDMLQKRLGDVEGDKKKMEGDKNKLQQDVVIQRADLQKREMQIEELKKEVEKNKTENLSQKEVKQKMDAHNEELKKEIEKLKSESAVQQENLMQQSQTESDILTQDLEETKRHLLEAQKEAELKVTVERESTEVAKQEVKKLDEINKKLKSDLEENTQRFQGEKEALEDKSSELKSKVANLSQEMSQKSQQIEHYKKQLASVEGDQTSQKMNADNEKLKLAERIRTLEEAQTSKNMDADTEKLKLAEHIRTLEKAQTSKNMDADTEKLQLAEHIRTLEQAQTSKNLDADNEKLKLAELIRTLEQAQTSKNMDADTEKLQLAEHIRTLEKAQTSKNLDSDNEKLKLTERIRTLEVNHSALTSQKLEADSDKSRLNDRIGTLEAQLKEMQLNANNVANDSGDPLVARLQKDKESSVKQVDFLNSIIVDMQRKNEEMKVRLEIMERDGIYGNGDVNSDDISTSRVLAPRLFCDICDMFDLHDTEDCPKQAMSESPPPILNHGDRKQVRPYCDICEVFGHPTSDCDDEQTF